MCANAPVRNGLILITSKLVRWVTYGNNDIIIEDWLLTVAYNCCLFIISSTLRRNLAARRSDISFTNILTWSHSVMSSAALYVALN